MENDLKKRILDEQLFPYEGMSLEERNYYLNIIRNCKDICDTENQVNNQSRCEIVEMKFKKDKNIINANGSVHIGNENRCINSDIYIRENSIIVDMEVIRLCVNVLHKQYRVIDEFKLENDILKRRSRYNYKAKGVFENIENEEMKGRLK